MWLSLPSSEGSSPAAVPSEEQRGEELFSMALRFQHVYFLECSVAIQAIDITTDPSCSRKIDPEIALSNGSTECHHGSSSNKATGHPDKYSSNSSKALKHQNDLR